MRKFKVYDGHSWYDSKSKTWFHPNKTVTVSKEADQTNINKYLLRNYIYEIFPEDTKTEEPVRTDGNKLMAKERLSSNKKMTEQVLGVSQVTAQPVPLEEVVTTEVETTEVQATEDTEVQETEVQDTEVEKTEGTEVEDTEVQGTEAIEVQATEDTEVEKMAEIKTEVVEKEKEPIAGPDLVDLDAMTKAELFAHAATNNITIDKSAKKAVIIEAIKQAQ